MKVLLLVKDSETLVQTKNSLEETEDRLEVSATDSIENAQDMLQSEDYDAIVSNYKTIESTDVERLIEDFGSELSIILFSKESEEEKPTISGYDQFVNLGNGSQYDDLARGIVKEVWEYKSGGKIKEREDWLKTLFENTLDGIVVLDRNLNILEVNRSALDMFNLESKEEALEVSPLDYVSPEEEERVKEIIKDEMFGKGKNEVREIRLMKDSGEKFWASAAGTKAELDDKDVVIITLRDITDRKEVEEREEFLHSLLRHDVRNKAQIARGYLELIEDMDLSEEEVGEYLEKTDRAIRDSVDLIEKVRTIREVEHEEEVEEVWIDPVIQNVLSERQSEISDNGFEIEYEKVDCKVEGGPLLEELFSNIIENSVFHSDGDKIKISGDLEEDYCTVIVEDDGKGISDRDKEKVFDREFKKGKSAGSGLGLFMVERIAKNYNGSVSVKDSELGGARFEVELNRVD